MSVPEHQSWREFYRVFPFDDLHRYHRPAALMAYSASGRGSIEARLKWLAPEPVPVAPMPAGGWSSADVATFRALGVSPPSKKD